MDQQRVICFIDGFNLYHAVHNLNTPYLKWVNLWSLATVFVSSKSQRLVDVLYFSAYANWLPDSKKRHQQYVKALVANKVQPVMGNFKVKTRKCPDCAYKWDSHEEKETDVNIALHLLNLAHLDKYDHAFLISNDSDLVPAIKMVRSNYPKKLITTIVPPKYWHSDELIRASSAKAKITVDHLKRCLLPEAIYDANGAIITKRPMEYAPPSLVSSPYFSM
jgi:uncharacterized LabA/DUF88 family protein